MALPYLNRQKHLPVLDGVRGFAILLVLMWHYLLLPQGEKGTFLYGAHLVQTLGWTGVDLFFVLSGFLITGILLDARDDPHYFRNFYARRMLRIFPVYYAYLLLYVIVTSIFLGGPIPETPWAALYGTNIVISLDKRFLSGGLDHFWSLAVEEHFYLLWPMVVYFLPSRELPRICRLFVVMSLVSRCVMWAIHNEYGAYALTPCRLDGFVVGGWIALMMRDERGAAWLQQWSKWICAGAAAVLGTILLCRGGLMWNDPIVFTFGITVLAIFYGSALVIVISGRDDRWLKGFFCSRPMTSLGKYSYGLYIFHRAAFQLCMWLSYQVAILAALREQCPLTFIVTVTVASTVLSIAVAWISWHCYERWFLAMKRYFVSTPPPQLPAQPAAVA